MNTDFQSYRIEGYARAAAERGLPSHFSVPLISQVEDTLWQGGCRNGTPVPEQITFVLSLYPWEQYTISEKQTLKEVEMYDHGTLPNLEQLHSLAELVNTMRDNGETVLVHCQAGLNRSGLVTALSLIKRGMKPSTAIAKLRSSRCDMVLCNDVFENYLLSLEKNK
jgi:protein-tyrosine phosphatase